MTNMLSLAILFFTFLNPVSENHARADIIGSPEDERSPSYVVFHDESTNVIKFLECPASVTPPDRFCTLESAESPLYPGFYEERLSRWLVVLRPEASQPGNIINHPAIAEIELKISRIESKIASGTLTPSERAEFDTQLTGLKSRLNDLKLKVLDTTLTHEENEKLRYIMDKLRFKNDIVLDEGEDIYKLPTAPFKKSWKDITSRNGIDPSSCQESPENCTIKDLLSGLSWSKMQIFAPYRIAAENCGTTLNDTTFAANTVRGYNGMNGWRLPTEKEMIFAGHHFLFRAAVSNWITSSDANHVFWTSSSCGQSDSGWTVYPRFYPGQDRFCESRLSSWYSVCVTP